ncbi:MAG: PDZ domain-containing protein [Planctomycetes bacterium]|nr:PDZ domain-containing protein [Planctomycetota bacterium]
MTKSAARIALALVVVAASVAAQEQTGSSRKSHWLIDADGLRLQIDLVDGRPVDCRLEGKDLNMTRDQAGNMTARNAQGRTVLRVIEEGAPHPVAPKREIRLGFRVTPITSLVAAQLGLMMNAAVAVTEVESGLPAERAGLLRHDVIVGINGETTASQASLAEKVAALGEGEEIVLHVKRVGRDLSISLRGEYAVGNPEQRKVPVLAQVPILSYFFQQDGRVADPVVMGADGLPVPGAVVSPMSAVASLDDVTLPIDPQMALRSLAAAALESKRREESMSATLAEISRRLNAQWVKDIRAQDADGRSHVDISVPTNEAATLDDVTDEETLDDVTDEEILDDVTNEENTEVENHVELNHPAADFRPAERWLAIEHRLDRIEAVLAELARKLDR